MTETPWFQDRSVDEHQRCYKRRLLVPTCEQFFLNAALAGVLCWAMLILFFVLLFKGLIVWIGSPK